MNYEQVMSFTDREIKQMVFEDWDVAFQWFREVQEVAKSYLYEANRRGVGISNAPDLNAYYLPLKNKLAKFDIYVKEARRLGILT